ncbi:hypothetical protein H4S07_006334 [Coemansia furcata]|uniref:Uncharacterized protein n=1 Tax=Coemansia furcata TaxID=417177 RepID=A0ACC1KV45_9FUNG|nr:hypothetical protein H4S07_006334 [Coemansia furcata]
MRNGASPLRVARKDLLLQGPRTPITLMAKRLSNDRLALQPLDANVPLFGSSPPHSAKRKQGGGLVDEVKKFRYVASTPSLALPLDDDIVDSDTENRAIPV